MNILDTINLNDLKKKLIKFRDADPSLYDAYTKEIFNLIVQAYQDGQYDEFKITQAKADKLLEKFGV